MERFFNIAGPCNPADHYMLSATERLPEIVSLVRKKQYFVIHAQRQCGKTTAILVLQAFLQRVLNGISPERSEHCEAMSLEGCGEIIREMALGKEALDLGVLYRGAKYAVEVKLRYLWDRSPGKALEQVRSYTDHLGVGEGWLVVFDPDMAKPWDEKIAHEDRIVDGRPIHVFYC